MNYGATARGQKTSTNVIRQPFAPLPVNIIDSIVITQELDPSVILAEWIAYDPSISVYSQLRATQAVKLFINWSDRNGTVALHQGDYFTFVVPDIFLYDYITNATDVPITNDAGEVVATYSIYDNSNNMKEVRITFTDYVENHTDISGDFWMLLFVGNVASTEQKTLEFVINDTLVAQGEVTVTPVSGNLTPRNRKVGYSSPTRSAGGYYIFEWIVYVNMGENAVNGFNTLAGFSFEDIIPADSPHIFLTDAIRQDLGIPSADYQAQIGEYTGADSFPPQIRYQRFLYQYNSTGSDIWYNFINWNTLVNGLTTVGINGGEGLNVSGIEVSDKLFSANLGTLTRPTAIRFYTISTVKITESALGDSEVVGLFKNTFRGSYGEDLSSSLTLYRFEAGGSAQGIYGDYSFSFIKVNVSDEGVPGAMYSLYTSQNFALGADRFVFSDEEGVVSFNHLPIGTYYLFETRTPFGYVANSTVYRVVISSQGFDIYYGENFENILTDNKIVNRSENETQPAVVILSGRKNLTGSVMEAGMFSYAVKDSNGNTVATGTNSADGSIQFSSIEYTSPGVYTYTVEEVRGYDTRIIYDGSIFPVTVTVTVENQSLVAEAVYPTGGIVFYNSFVTTPVSVVLAGSKNLTGSALENNAFSFVVKDSAGNTAAMGTNNADGSIQFSSIEFNIPGVYTFTVEEVRGSGSGIIYDGSLFTVTVTVTVNTDGELVADVTYPNGGIVFNNRFVTTPVSVTLVGSKNLTGSVLENNAFSFVVKDSAGNTAAMGTNNADGSIQFSSIEFDTPGVYTFTVEEVRGSGSGIIYDGSIFTVTVTVTVNTDGELVSEVTYPNGGIVFNNRFVITPVSVTLSGRKNLTGSALESNAFSFVVKDSAGNTVGMGTNNADGSIQFSSIEFDTPGVYTFTVEEVRGSGSGIIYDGSIFTVTVTVTVNTDGELVADVTYPNGGIVFNNSFVTTPVSVTLVGSKNLTGSVLENNAFSFVVKDSAGNTAGMGTNNADGSIQFSSIEFDTPGVYTFTVEEVRGSGGGIIYDGSIFTVTVTVTVNGSGNLVADVTYPNGGIVFNNRFVITPVSVVLAGSKNLTGAVLESNAFSFVVKDSVGNTAATGTNNADGSIQFSSIEFDTPGVYTFTVEEVRVSGSGIVYDGSIFTVTVTVTVNTDGELVADVTYPTGGIVFNNSFVTTPVSVTLTGRKNLTGSTIEAGMFNYAVKDSNGNTVATGTNNADGSVQFSSIEYDSPGVHTYTVEEVRGYDTRIIYDGSIFPVTVNVTVENQNLVAEAVYPTGGIVFNNLFVAAPVSVTLSGRKNLTGSTMEAGMFRYAVKDSNGNTVATGTNNADGSVQFSSIEYNSPGVHTYTVEEVRGYDTRIIYDGSIFPVTVNVTVENQNLVAEAVYPTGGIVFNNRFVAAPVSVMLMGTKRMLCRTLENGMFSFIVKNSIGNTVATATNNADGSIMFSSIEFDAAGVYTFTVEEVRGADSGIIYDGSIFEVTVTVTVNGSGNLVAEVTYPDGGIVFNNRSVVTPSPCCIICCRPCCTSDHKPKRHFISCHNKYK